MLNLLLAPTPSTKQAEGSLSWTMRMCRLVVLAIASTDQPVTLSMMEIGIRHAVTAGIRVL